MHRFYVPPENWIDDRPPSLSGDEAHHCCRVARIREGDRIEVLDGRGRSACACVKGFSDGEVILDCQGQPGFAPRSSPLVHLAFAIPKGRTVDLVIQKATELGADRITPVITERTIARPGSDVESRKKLAKWRRVALETTKQCGRKWIPEINGPVSWDEFLRSTTGSLGFLCALVSGRQPLRDHLQSLGEEKLRRLDELVLAVGPEGDFTPVEYEAARIAGFCEVDLGNFVLRAETASIAGLAILAYELRLLDLARG